MAEARARVVFSGFVQGVGFRFTARMVAGGFGVTGHVRNRTDGRVELESQGERREVEAYLAELRSRVSGHVTGEELTWIGAVAGEEGFSIRF